MEQDQTPTGADLLEADEVAQALRVTRWSIYRWAKAGVIPSGRAGRVVRFELARVIEALRHTSTEAETSPAAARRSARSCQKVVPLRPTPPPASTATTASLSDHDARVLEAVSATRALLRKT